MFKKAQGTDTLYTSVLKQRHVRPATAKKVCKKKTKPVVRVSGLDDVSPYTLPLNTSHKEQLRRRDKPFPSVHVPSLRPEQQTLHNHFFRRHQLQLLQSHWESKATGRWCPSEQRIVTDGYRNQVVRRICFERLRLRIETLWEELKIPKTERRHITATYMSDGAIPDAVFCQNYLNCLLQHRESTIKVLRSIAVREELMRGTTRTEAACKKATVAVLHAIAEWRMDLFDSKPFLWRNGIDYLEKMKTDQQLGLDPSDFMLN